jgi:hypothetical protein
LFSAGRSRTNFAQCRFFNKLCRTAFVPGMIVQLPESAVRFSRRSGTQLAWQALQKITRMPREKRAQCTASDNNARTMSERRSVIRVQLFFLSNCVF